MKTLLKISFLFIISTFLYQPVQGQSILRNITNKAKDKVEQRIEERVERKIDEKIDESLDKVEESLEKDDTSGNQPSDNENSNDRDARTQARMQGLLKGIGMSGTPVPIADSYSFNHKIQMQIESYDKSGKKTSDGEFITHLDPASKSLAYQVVSGDIGEKGQGMFIIDAENGATIILSDEGGKKTGLVYGIGSFMQTLGESYDEEALEDSPELYLANPNVKKTGNTKTISGYKCEEYIYSDEESESEIWITKDLKMNTQDFFSTLFKTSLYSQGIGWGYMMEVTTKDKNTGEKSLMRVTDVDARSNVNFSMKDYVGVAGFEPATPWSQTRCANRTALYPDNKCGERGIRTPGTVTRTAV
jgi:hypothetical protein